MADYDYLTDIADFVTNYGGDAATLIRAGVEFAAKVKASSPTTPGLPKISTGVPAADRAIAESLGVSEIAGAYSLNEEDIIAVAQLLLRLGTLAF